MTLCGITQDLTGYVWRRSLGIVLWVAAVGHLNRAAAEAVLNRLAQSLLWVSARVLAEARSALAQLFL